MKKNEMENRSYAFDIAREVRAEQGESVLRGRAIVYNRATDIGGWFQEIIMPGALEGADMTDVPLLVNHNDRMIPVARSRRNTPNSTLRLIPGDEGLDIEARIDTERNMTARELDSSVERGDLDGMSFRFSVADEKWENLESDYPTRRILRFGKIGEVSAVTWPAYEATTLYARSKEALDSARSALDNARQQSVKSVDTDIELEKAKFKFISTLGGMHK